MVVSDLHHSSEPIETTIDFTPVEEEPKKEFDEELADSTIAVATSLISSLMAYSIKRYINNRDNRKLMEGSSDYEKNFLNPLMLDIKILLMSLVF